jgi:hypothetical protein
MGVVRLCKRAAVAACALYTFNQYVCSPWLLSERSMEPSFREGQVVLCSPWPWCGKVERGDVVVGPGRQDLQEGDR